MKFKSLNFLIRYFSAFSFFILVFEACQSNTQEIELPNIIVVLADDLGYGDLSIYVQDNKIKTPNLDQMAREGLRFTDAHTPASVCTPTRYGLLTGRYNWRTSLKQGVLTGKSKALIPTKRTTIASLLKRKSYQTAFIGKWHLGWDWALKNKELEADGEGWNPEDFKNLDFSKPIKNGPNTLGFDYSFGHSGSLDMAPYVYVENDMPTALPNTVTVNNGVYSWWREGPTAPDFIHDEVTPNFFKRGIKYIKNHAGKERPFFLYLALPSPHTPILPTKEWQGKSQLNPYGDFTMMIDNYMGKLLKTIDELKIKDNTLVIFTSDNGCSPAAKIDEMQQKGHFPSGQYRGHKADIFEGGHRVPFIVQWPNKIAKATTSDDTICLTDLMATFADISSIELKDNEAEDSYSLLSIFEQKNNSSSLREATVHHSINGSFALRKGEWKLIMAPGSGGWSSPTPQEIKRISNLPPIQLYNLKKDPGETKNLEGQFPEKVLELQELLYHYIVNGRSTQGVHQKNDSIAFNWHQVASIKQQFERKNN